MSICVKDVMARQVITIDVEQSAKNAARMMTKFGISGLVVLSEGDLVGILTERDILSRVVASGHDPDDVKVREIMSEPVIVVNPAMPLDKAVMIMFKEKIKKLPVVAKVEDALRLVGILSLTDIARLHPKLLENIRMLGHMNEEAVEARADFYVS